MLTKLQALYSRLHANQFLRHNFIFFTGTFIAATLNYLYYPILSRLMGLEDFGEAQVLVSLFLQIAIFLGALNIVVANVTASSRSDREKNRIILELEKLALTVMSTIIVLSLIFIIQVQKFLQFRSAWPFVSLLAAVLLSLPLTLRNAFLQGRHDFLGISIGQIIGSVGKIIFSVALVIIGLRAFGAITGIVIAQTAAIAYIVNRAYKKGFYHKLTHLNFKTDLKLIQPELLYGVLVLIVSLITTLFYSGDIIIVKHYFSPTEAGQYGGIAVVARIIFFLTASISGVLFPLIKMSQARSENRGVLMRSLGLVGLLAGSALIVFWLVPRWVITLLVGPKYLPLAHLLPRLSLAIFLIALVNILFYYCLALRKWFSAAVATSGAIFTLLLTVLRHSSIAGIINNLIYGSILMLGLLIGWGFYGRVKTRDK